MGERTKNLLRELAECLAACNHCHNSCLEEPEVAMMTGCIRLDKECAAICSVAMGFVASSSANDKKILELCADICGQCAAECGKHNNSHCSKCAQACRSCEQACREYVSAPPRC